MKLTLAFLLAAGAYAACPNACSKHGECGEYDSCTCHDGFQGSDCSERVCLYNWAFVTTANGDLNFDGDRYDGTVYSKTVALNKEDISDTTGTGGNTLVTQGARGGTWETWPYFASQQEGHFYMECSNRGICDRSTAICSCFDGYEGPACQRMRCPEGCSGHGVCQSVKDYDNSYDKWDKDMARSCKCDPGYSGPSCQTRDCPKGNDVLTKSNELFETQFVDIYSVCEGANNHAACTAQTSSTLRLGGYARLTYTDQHGQALTTKPFAVMEYDGSASAIAVGAAAKTALTELPNNIIDSSITVTAGWCETTMDATADVSTDTVGKIDAMTAYKGWRAVGSTEVVNAATGKVILNGDGVAIGATTSASTGTGLMVTGMVNPMCTRLKIQFNNMPGNLNPVGVDVSQVLYGGETNAMNGNEINKASVSSEPPATAGAGGTTSLSIGYTRPSTVVKEITGTAPLAANSITGPASSFQQGTTDTFYPGTRVRIECEYSITIAGSSQTKYRNLGTYTVSTVTADLPTATVIKVTETIADSDCTAGTSKVRVTSVSNVITTGALDFTAAASITSAERISFGQGSTLYTPESKVATSGVKYYSSTGYIILDQEFANSWSADVAAATGHLFIDGDGTMENTSCGDRGMCQEDGTCKCFAGYTGDSCSIQKSIANA